jgi:hypothetical protein
VVLGNAQAKKSHLRVFTKWICAIIIVVTAYPAISASSPSVISLHNAERLGVSMGANAAKNYGEEPASAKEKIRKNPIPLKVFKRLKPRVTLAVRPSRTIEFGFSSIQK